MADTVQAPEKQEIATLEKDVQLFAGYFQRLQNPDRVLQLEANGDLTIYDDIGRDPHVASVLRTRALAVIGKEWKILPVSERRRDTRVAEFVEQTFGGFPFDLSRRAILRGGVLKGFAVSEVMWEMSEGDYTIAAMRPRAQRRWCFEHDGSLRLLTRAAPYEGELVAGPDRMSGPYPRKFQTFVFGDEAETPYGVGLGRELYWPWWFKKHGIKFWLIFADRFGQPTPWGRYPPGTPEAEQTNLLDALQALQTDAAIITPEGMSVELLEAARSSTIDCYETLCDFMNDEMSKSVLGQTATVSGTPGKLGQEDAQENVRLDLVDADGDALCEALNQQIVRWVVDLNFGPQSQYPEMWIQTEEAEDLNSLAERDERLAGLVAIPTRYFRDTYNLPEPKEGEEVATRSAMAVPPPPGNEPPGQFAHRTHCAGCGAPLQFQAGGEPAADPARVMADAALEAAGSNDLVDQAYAILQEVGSFEEFRERLAAAEFDLEATREQLRDARLLGQLAGREAIQREVEE